MRRAYDLAINSTCFILTRKHRSGRTCCRRYGGRQSACWRTCCGNTDAGCTPSYSNRRCATKDKIRAQQLAHDDAVFAPSSAYHVSHNLESQILLCAMLVCLHQLGWHEVEVMDDIWAALQPARRHADTRVFRTDGGRGLPWARRRGCRSRGFAIRAQQSRVAVTGRSLPCR